MISKNGGSHKKTLTSSPKANPSKAQSGFTCVHHQNSAFLGCFTPKQSESHSAVLGNFQRDRNCLVQVRAVSSVQKKLDHPRNRGLIHQGYQPLTTTQKKLKWFPFPMSQGFRSGFSAKYHWENWERSCSDFPIFQFSGFPFSQWFSIGKISSANPTGPTNTFFLRQWSAAQHLPGQLNLGGVPGWTCR